MSDRVTYHPANYESAAESFSVHGPSTYPPTVGDVTSNFKFGESYNFSNDVADSELRPNSVLFGPDSEMTSEELMNNKGSILSGFEASSEYASFETGNLAAPAAYATSSILNFQAQRDYQSDLQGNSVAGHSFLAPLQANSNLQTHDIQNSVASALVGAGALFGPEGLAAGLAAGAVVSSIDFTSPVSVPTDTGDTITADQL